MSENNTVLVATRQDGLILPLAAQDLNLESETARVYYKHLKEDIVSGFNGGPKLEVLLLVLYLPVSFPDLILSIVVHIHPLGDDLFPQKAFFHLRQTTQFPQLPSRCHQFQPGLLAHNASHDSFSSTTFRAKSSPICVSSYILPLIDIPESNN